MLTNKYVFHRIVVSNTHIYIYIFGCVVLRLVYPVLPVSLDCPILIAPSVFSNVYVYTEDESDLIQFTFHCLVIIDYPILIVLFMVIQLLIC